MSDVRLIDANAYEYPGDLIHMPTIDAVPVVRCRECMNWQRDWECTSGEPGSHYCTMIDLVTKPDFYCKSGEKMRGGAADGSDA